MLHLGDEKFDRSCKTMLFLAVLAFIFPRAMADEHPKGAIVNKSATELGENLEPAHVKIVWNLKDGSKDSDAIDKKSEKKSWSTACSAIGRSVMVGQGPWGMGAFSGYSCWIDDKKTAGNPKGKPWTIEYKESEDSVSVELSDPDNRKISEVVYKFSQYSVYFFADKEFTDLIALKLLDGMPVLGFVKKGTISSDGTYVGRYPAIIPKFGRKFPVVPPPKSLMAYQLTMTKPGNLFYAEVFGRISQTSLDSEGNTGGTGAKKTEKVKDPVVHWRAGEELVQKNKEVSFWVHNEAGRDQLAPELQKAIDQAQKFLADAADEGLLSNVLHGIKKGLYKTTASGYVGLRYGPQVLSGDPLLGKTAFFGIVSEIRGGPLEGVRLYYDKLPEKKVSQDGFDTSIAWGRFIIGKSFGLKLNKFVDRIDLTPKLGVWNFHAKLPTQYDEEGKVASTGSFDLDRAMSFALEIGMEWQSSWYTIRPWYSFDAAAAISKVNSKRVTSNRGGLDTYWTAGPKFSVLGVPFKTAWLAFFMFEKIGLVDNDPNTNLQEGESEITALDFSSGYLGAGIAISW